MNILLQDESRLDEVVKKIQDKCPCINSDFPNPMVPKIRSVLMTHQSVILSVNLHQNDLHQCVSTITAHPIVRTISDTNFLNLEKIGI